ncbi:MAG: hypothetical protein JRJ51_10460 [Deltaproteobacteria bacterium]|nr:hypothetical protein [Deltaproteobacteria bacterium]
MGELRERFSALMTGGADMRGVLLKAFSLSILCTLFTAPYFHYLLFLSPAQTTLPLKLNLKGFLVTQLFLLFIICLLSSIVGLSFSRKLELPGIGDWQHFKKSIPYLFLLGAVMTILSYYAFDRYFFQISQASYPKDSIYLFTYPLKAAFTDEVILRLCFVTLAVGLFRNKVVGVVLVSAVASVFTIKYFQFMGIGFQFNYLSITQIMFSFWANIILGYLFVTRGLLYSMALNFLLGMKYVIVSWSLG